MSFPLPPISSDSRRARCLGSPRGTCDSAASDLVRGFGAISLLTAMCRDDAGLSSRQTFAALIQVVIFSHSHSEPGVRNLWRTLMRIILAGLAGAALLAATPLTAFANPKFSNDFPSATQMEAAQHGRNPCATGSNNPHELVSLQAAAQKCRDLKSQAQANPDVAALRERCAKMARALTGMPC